MAALGREPPSENAGVFAEFERALIQERIAMRAGGHQSGKAFGRPKSPRNARRPRGLP